MPSSPDRTRRRSRRPWTALLAGLAGAAVLALSTSTSLATFTASMTNSVNQVSSGTLVMQEQNADGTVTCLSTDGTGNDVTTDAATCTTINKYGAAILVPGGSVSTVVRFRNTGTVPAASFTLAPGTCTQTGATTGSATDLCARLGVVITQTVGATTTTVSPAGSTLASLAGGGALTLGAPVAPNQQLSFRLTVTLPTGLGNTYQGLTAAQPLLWTFTS